MPASDNHLSETDIRSPQAQSSIVRADESDVRPWLVNTPVCTALAHFQISHLAVAHMPAPFRIVRTRLSGSYFLACFGGEGRVLVDGRWAVCRPGQAMLLPPGTLHAFHTTPRHHWDFCWVRYQQTSRQKPLTTATTPVIAKYDAEPLRLAILGLYRECTTHAATALIDRWCELIHTYVLRFAQPASMDQRLWQLWEKVASDLPHPWSVDEMAQLVHLGDKQLQRLCLQELGRTPRQHLIWLRMRHAGELLMQQAGKIETIATRVGYHNPFVFSSTFKRIMGCSPSQYADLRR